MSKDLLKGIGSRVLWLLCIILLGAIVISMTPSSLLAGPEKAPNVSSTAGPGSSLVKGEAEEDNPIFRYWQAAVAAAKRHNKLEKVSDGEFAQWMIATLMIELGGPTWAKNRFYSQMVYPVWDAVAVTSNDRLSSNVSIGIAQIRPETAAQLMQGWIWHQGYLVYHGVQPAYSVQGEGPYGVSSALLARPEVSIEYLAANMEMGASVAQLFGFKPTAEDLVRWHNTGVGVWDLRFGNVNDGVWAKGSNFVSRVREYLAVLRAMPDNPLQRYFVWDGKETSPL